LSTVFAALGVAMICWLCVGWEQDIDEKEYYYIRNVEYDNGTSVQKIIIDERKLTESEDVIGSINITKELDRIFPNGTIIKAYRYKSMKKGVCWLNGHIWYYEPVLPDDENYEEAKKLVKDIKIDNVVEITNENIIDNKE